MSVDTMARLFELKNIVGVKDATADLNRVDQQLKKWVQNLFSYQEKMELL